MSNNLVRLERVSKTYRSADRAVPAVKDVDLEVREGQFVSLIGPSGCGKSTLLMIVAGLLIPERGQVFLREAPVTKPVKDLGIVFQADLLLSWRTVLQNVMLQAEIRRLDKHEYRARALDLLGSVGLDGFMDAYPHELSGGMRQRVSICRALLHDAPLLVMDEPFGALDALAREQMNEMLLGLLEERGKTVLFVTHDIAEAVFLADEVYAMSPRPGRIVERTHIELQRPRRIQDKDSPAFVRYQKRLRATLRSGGPTVAET